MYCLNVLYKKLCCIKFIKSICKRTLKAFVNVLSIFCSKYKKFNELLFIDLQIVQVSFHVEAE